MNENREDENFRVILEENSKFLLRPNATNKIFKDECMLSMRTPFTSGGVYLNLKTFESFAEEFLPFDFERTKNKIYLHIQKKKKKKKNEEKVDEKVKQEEEITKIALGAHGGFDVLPAEEVSSFYEIFIFPEKVAFPLDHPFVTLHLLNVVNGVIESEGNNVSCHIENWEEEIKVSKYSRDLPYAFEGLPALQCKKISPHPNDWKCEDCGASTNLWLNLSDGYIGCGRKIFSVGGGCQNGDEGAALRHYYTTGSKYPLAVKLGTITPHSADVFSYAREENDKVIDLHLAEHLERFGIKIQQLEKTEKTTTELEVHRNLQFDWTVVTEENESLKKLVGPGFVGLENLGNSCYMNSVLQMIISLRETKQKFVDFFEDIIHSLPNDSPSSEDFCIQFSKLASAISNSPAYLTEGLDLSKDEVYLSPRMIRQIVARNHPEFHSSRQQDAEEYLSYFLEVLEENEKNLNFRMKKKKKTN